MLYDVKIFEAKKEQETIRELTYGQVMAITRLLKRHEIKHLVRDEKDQYWTVDGDTLLCLKVSVKRFRIVRHRQYLCKTDLHDGPMDLAVLYRWLLDAFNPENKGTVKVALWISPLKRD